MADVPTRPHRPAVQEVGRPGQTRHLLAIAGCVPGTGLLAWQVVWLLWCMGPAAYAPAMPEADLDRSCGVCGKPVGRIGTCGSCGAPVSPSLDEWLSGGRSWFLWRRPHRPWGGYVAAAVVLVVGCVAIIQYAMSEEGWARLPEVALLIFGPLLLVGGAWLGYRVWYRRRYPDDE